MATGSRRLSSLRDLLFPPRCIACNQLLPWHSPVQWDVAQDALCSACQKQWKSEMLETCGVCAKEVTACRCMPLSLQKVKCGGFGKLVYYEPQKSTPVQNKILYRIKRKHDVHATRFLAEELAKVAEDLMREEGIAREDVLVTYLPRTHTARLEYGTDQAEALAKELARVCGVSMRALIGRKWFQNTKQKNLSYTRRFQNARLAFSLARDADCKGKTVLLVDDMITTGAGMARCTQLLRHARANAVYCLSIASDAVNKDQIR